MNITNYLTHIFYELKNNEEYLNELDADIGDGDFGSNVVNGFRLLIPYVKKECTKSTSLGVDLMKISGFLMEHIDGNIGSLFGIIFMQMALSIKNKTEINNSVFASALDAACNGIKSLGKTKLGDKTILDALYPVIEVFKQAKDYEPLPFNSAYEKAMIGTNQSMEYKAKKGRASYLGERSIGHIDPGAQLVVLVFKALREV